MFELLLQGADTVIYERLASGNDDIKNRTRDHMEQYGSAGLRTLCLAYRDLNQEMYESWNEKFIQAKSSLRDREKKLDEVCVSLVSSPLSRAFASYQKVHVNFVLLIAEILPYYSILRNYGYIIMAEFMNKV